MYYKTDHKQVLCFQRGPQQQLQFEGNLLLKGPQQQLKCVCTLLLKFIEWASKRHYGV